MKKLTIIGGIIFLMSAVAFISIDDVPREPVKATICVENGEVTLTVGDLPPDTVAVSLASARATVEELGFELVSSRNRCYTYHHYR